MQHIQTANSAIGVMLYLLTGRARPFGCLQRKMRAFHYGANVTYPKVIALKSNANIRLGSVEFSVCDQVRFHFEICFHWLNCGTLGADQ